MSGMPWARRRAFAGIFLHNTKLYRKILSPPAKGRPFWTLLGVEDADEDDFDVSITETSDSFTRLLHFVRRYRRLRVTSASVDFRY